MGLIEDAAETLETEVNNLKLNVQDAVEALDLRVLVSLRLVPVPFAARRRAMIFGPNHVGECAGGVVIC